MINKVFREYTDKIYNIDSNYEAILSRSKKGVSKMKSKKKKVLNIAAMFIAVILVGVLSTQIYAKIQWNIEFKEYQNREYATGSGVIQQAIESGYNEVIDMEYNKQDGISVKADSLILSDDHFEANIHFIFDEGIQLNSETFEFGFAVYDDENNIYGISERTYQDDKKNPYGNYRKYIYEDLGVKYNKRDIFSIQYSDSASCGNISAEDREIVSGFTMNSTKGFPRSKKIYIRIFELGYTMRDIDALEGKYYEENFDISDAEWIFEIEVPEKFYERQTTQLQLEEEMPEVKMNKMSLTETGLVIQFQSEDMTNTIMAGMNMETGEWQKVQEEMIYITDGEENTYYPTSLGTTSEENGLKATFAINKAMLEKKLFLNVKVDGKQYMSELVKK